MTSFLICIVLLVCACYLRVIIHELGHLLLLYHFKAKIQTIMIGGNRWSFNIGNVSCKIGPFPLIGCVDAMTPRILTPKEDIFLFGSGPLVEVIFCCVFAFWLYAFFPSFISMGIVFTILSVLNFVVDEEGTDFHVIKKAWKQLKSAWLLSRFCFPHSYET